MRTAICYRNDIHLIRGASVARVCRDTTIRAPYVRRRQRHCRHPPDRDTTMKPFIHAHATPPAILLPCHAVADFMPSACHADMMPAMRCPLRDVAFLYARRHCPPYFRFRRHRRRLMPLAFLLLIAFIYAVFFSTYFGAIFAITFSADISPFWREKVRERYAPNVVTRADEVPSGVCRRCASCLSPLRARDMRHYFIRRYGAAYDRRRRRRAPPIRHAQPADVTTASAMLRHDS